MRVSAPRFRSVKYWLLGSSLISLLMASSAWACDEKDHVPSTPPASDCAVLETACDEAAVLENGTVEIAQVPSSSSALKVFIDPQTGQPVVPPPAKRRESPLLADPLMFSDQGLQRVELPDGSSYVHLQDRFRSMLVVKIDENGKPRISHQDVAPVAAETADENAEAHDE